MTFTDTVSASSGTPGGTVTFYSCTTNTCGTKTSLGTGTLSSDKATYSTSSAPSGHHLRRGRLRRLGQLRRLDLQRGDPGGQRARDYLGPDLLAQPVVLRLLGHLHRHGLGLLGHARRHGDLLQLHHLACSTKTSLGTGTLSSGKATYSTSSLPVGTTYVEAVYGASGNYGGSTSNVVSQVVNALVHHLGPHQLAQPVELRLLGHLHRHGLGLLGHGERHGDLLQLHHVGVHLDDLARDRDPELGQGHLVHLDAARGHHLRRGGLRASGNYGGSTSNVVSQVVNALSTTTALTSSSNPSTYGTSVTFTAAVSASSGTPGGTVTFYSCTTSACGPRPRSGPGP